MMSPASPEVFNRQQVRRRRGRATTSYQDAEFIKLRVIEDIEDRLLATARKFSRALVLGGYNPALAERIQPYCDTLIETDFSPARLARDRKPKLVADEEWLPFRDNSFDLILSPLSLHWVNDLPGTLIQINRCLKPDGYFVGVMPGGASLNELRQSLLRAEDELTGGAEMRVSPFADALDMSGLLQRAGFALPVSDRDRLTVRYANMFDLLRDLQAAGETYAPHQTARKGLSRRILMRAAEIYAEDFSDPDGRIRVTLELVWMTGWSPHASQPKPKRPGSAKASLAEAVGASEKSAGEKTGLAAGRPSGPKYR